MTQQMTDYIPSEAHGDTRIPTGPRGFPIVAQACCGPITVDGRSVYCITCGQTRVWRQVAHTAADDRDYLAERMLLDLDLYRTMQ